MGFIVQILVKVLISVLLKIIYSVASEQVISGIIFKGLHALAKRTKSEKDDDFINKIQGLYNSPSIQENPAIEHTIDQIKILKSEDNGQ